MLTVVPEVLTDRGTGEWRQELHRSRIASGRRDHHAVVHCMVLFEGFYHAGHRRAFLTDGHVNAKYTEASLVNDRIDRDRRLARLTISNDQLALASPDRNHSIDGLDAGL